jgi:hypothetical protein
MLSVLGVGIHKDYCCGKLRSTSFFHQQTEKKHCKGMSMAGCCRTENSFYKLTDSHENVSTASISNNLPNVDYIIHESANIAAHKLALLINISDHVIDPPDKNHSSVYLLNCNFRI